MNSLTPYKKKRGKNLISYQRWFNSNLSKYRVYTEHVNCRIKQRYFVISRESICCAWLLFLAFITLKKRFRTGLINLGKRGKIN
ncbi:MAG: transposase family protein [Streptococcaceae bacterium]|nr:transposase family protein [Streptococcaceae bacterium]